MDMRYFLDERIAFSEQFYLNSSVPFHKRHRKIKAHEEPSASSDKSAPEPRFLAEWTEAEDSLQLIGHACLSMLSASSYLHFKDWECQLGVAVDSSLKAEFKRGWLNGYKAYFLWHFGVKF